ncbi:hypothetical protein B6I21_04760 [candidate division KSB1 bacterium 4572_119]|nr:MAG: hypothetical protein B6I21_04760 [candidate division KSB1 bacterium 4572_119]
MKIGEVAVISQNGQQKDDFIRSICRKIDLKNERISFGKFDANDQLALHLYGLSIDDQDNDLSWDLISRKMLGYIVIFDWENQISLESIKPVVDNLSYNMRAPFIIIANIKEGKKPPIPSSFFKNKGIVLSTDFRFTFGQVNKPESARKSLRLLVDMLLERVNNF